MYVESTWNQISEELKKGNFKRVYVMGNTDCGKTTLCQYLIRELSKEKTSALIDCDPGQSTLGLPTTLNAALFYPEDEKPAKIISRFIGDTSPHRKLMQALLSVHRLLDKVNEECEAVVIDSSGYSSGNSAAEFQAAMIELIQPDAVVLIEREQELEPFASQIECFKNITIRRILVSEHVKARSMPMRKEYREEKYRDYFKEAKLQVVDISPMSLCGSVPVRFTVQSVRGRLIAFCDHEKFLIKLAVARSLYENDKICVCLVPEFDSKEAAFLQFGDLFLTNDFKEEHPLRAQ